MAKESKWTPNEKQKLFMEILAKTDGKGATLAQASVMANQTIVSGSINILKTKGLVETEKVYYDCDIVRRDNGEIVGSKKHEATIYKLKA